VGCRPVIPKAPQTDSRGGDSQRARFLTPLAQKIRAMPSAVRLREDYLAEELRALARRSKNVNQSRRLGSRGIAGQKRSEISSLKGTDVDVGRGKERGSRRPIPDTWHAIEQRSSPFHLAGIRR
jgi:hypothetical protein